MPRLLELVPFSSPGRGRGWMQKYGGLYRARHTHSSRQVGKQSRQTHPGLRNDITTS